MKNVVPLERRNEVLEVEWKKAKEIADYLGISRPTLSKLTHCRCATSLRRSKWRC